VPDTNGIINLIDSRNVVKRFERRFLRKKIRIILPEFVLKEVQKIRGLSREEVLSFLKTKARKILVIKPNEDVKAAAKNLEAKYSEAHFPDSILLATAQFGSYTVVTYDRGMLKCAKSEGIPTFCPKNGGRK